MLLRELSGSKASLTRLGRYRLLRRIGHGGMAEVYLARCVGASGFEKQVAIKTLLPAFRGIGEYQRLLIEEAKLASRLQHRNLVSVHELAVDRGVYYAVMDHVNGADLRSLTRRCPERLKLSMAAILAIAEQVAHALEYVHRVTDDNERPLGLVHRDVSPSNILISRSGEVKLADFGIAKATMLADSTLSNMRKGTYAYMSPEQVSGVPLTSGSDRFGLGIVLAELVSGTRPFDGATVMETLDNIKAAEPPRLDGVPASVRAIILTCLQRDPCDRFDSADALARALSRAGRVHPVITPADIGHWATAVLDATRSSDESPPVQG